MTTDALLHPVLRTSWRFVALVLALGAIVAAGGGAWLYQAYHGIGLA